MAVVYYTWSTVYIFWYSFINATSGAFGDFGDLKCLYHIEPVESISDEVRNIITIFTSLNLATDTTSS